MTPERENCAAAPITELLRGVPIDFANDFKIDNGCGGWHHIPIGIHCHDAADKIDALTAEIATLKGEVERLRVDNGILTDDQRSAESTIAELKDNCRCPECGCATIADAESQECGCDAPVCLIEVGDTLAKAYVREFELAKNLLQKSDAISNKLATLRTQRDALVTAAQDFKLYQSGYYRKRLDDALAAAVEQAKGEK